MAPEIYHNFIKIKYFYSEYSHFLFNVFFDICICKLLLQINLYKLINLYANSSICLYKCSGRNSLRTMPL